MKSLSYCLVVSLAFVAPGLSAHASSGGEDKSAELSPYASSRVERGDADLTMVGDIDVYGYCRDRHGYLSEAKCVAGDPRGYAYCWICTNPGDFSGSTPKGPPFTLNMNDACQMQHGAGTFAASADLSDPRSWRCYRW